MSLRLTSSTLALAVLAAPAAGLTPAEVWDAWVTEYGRTGYTITEGSRDLAGEVLTLKDVAFVQEAEGKSLTITVPEIVLTGTGDGNVRSTFSETITVEADSRDGEDRPVTATGTVRTPGMEVLSSGDAAARTDRVTAPSVVLTLDRGDLPEGEQDLADVASVTLTNVAAEAVSRDGGQSMTSSTRVAKLDYRVDYADAEGSLQGTGSIADIQGNGEVTMPGDAKLALAEQLNAALEAGAMLSGTLTVGAGSHDLEFTGTSEGEAQEGTATAGLAGAEVSFRMAQDGLAYQGAMSDLDVNLTATGMPAPVAYALEEATFDIQGPVSAAEAPAPFKFAYSLGGLTLGDQVWTMFDPETGCRRDPASIDIDLTGMVRLTRDLFDPTSREAAADTDVAAADAPRAETEAKGEQATTADGTGSETPEAEAEMPFDVSELSINQIAIEAAGVKAEATGKLTVPEGGDFSQPVGSISARYEGVNGLIDTLVAMGVISQDEVMGYRMMLTMFAAPAEGTDVLTTELQFNEGGEIIANGQKIR